MIIALSPDNKVQWTGRTSGNKIVNFIPEDDGDCQINYNTYELTGTYEDVYDVTFDSRLGHLAN